jgi:STE24 endopeptidase
MVQILIIASFVLLAIHDAVAADMALSPLSPTGAVVYTIIPLLLLAAGAHVVAWLCLRRLDATGRTAFVRVADLTVLMSRWGALLAFAPAVILAGWPEAVRSFVGDIIVVDEFLIVLPIVLFIAAGWLSIFDLDRRIRESVLLRQLNEGRPIFRPLTRFEFVWSNVRNQLLLVLVPILAIHGWNDTARWIIQRFGPDPDTTTAGATLASASQFVGVGIVFLFMPVVLRVVWDTVPLTRGPTRDRVAAVCRRHRVRIAELLVWRTHGSLFNAAVMGLVGRVRYILMTDGLLEVMPQRQLEAVAAHEVGHVRRRHLIWLGLSIVSALLLCVSVLSFVAESTRDFWDNVQHAGVVRHVVEIGITVVSLAAGLVAFGFVSRRFEWQADAFAVADLSANPDPLHAVPTPEPGQPPPTSRVTHEAAHTMISALSCVAHLNGLPIDRFTWRHGSIATRQRRLRKLVGLPIDELPIDRSIRRLKLLIAAVILAAIALTAYLALVPSPTSPGSISTGAE